MIVATDIALRAGGLAGGAIVGVGAVALAKAVPRRMDLEERLHPTLWWVVAAVIGVAYGWGTAGMAGGWALLPAYVAFGATTLAVALTDIDHQLIPNRILYPGFVVSGVLLALGAMAEGTGGRLGRAALAAVVYFVFLLVIALVVPGGFGMGDVKLALLLGLFLGYLGWGELLAGFSVGVLLGGVASVALLIFTNRGRKAKFAYGPYMVAGCWIALFWGAQLVDWYTRSGS